MKLPSPNALMVGELGGIGCRGHDVVQEAREPASTLNWICPTLWAFDQPDRVVFKPVQKLFALLHTSALGWPRTRPDGLGLGNQACHGAPWLDAGGDRGCGDEPAMPDNC